MTELSIESCDVYECRNEEVATRFNGKFCAYHAEGGMFNGESYEQYQIIESDFIKFTLSVPLNPDHFQVYSPLLRDIIMRCCTQIEIFFKEWGRYECIDRTCALYTEAESKQGNKKQGSKSWKIGSYHHFTKQILAHNKKIFVLPLNEHIEPFSSWTTETPPEWWSAYNKIKHDGHLHRKKANYQNALNALGALFQLHCSNRYSRNYLKIFSSYKVVKDHGNVIIKTEDITTPIDSKKYLFRARNSGGEELVNLKRDEMIDRLSSIG